MKFLLNLFSVSILFHCLTADQDYFDDKNALDVNGFNISSLVKRLFNVDLEDVEQAFHPKNLRTLNQDFESKPNLFLNPHLISRNKDQKQQPSLSTTTYSYKKNSNIKFHSNKIHYIATISLNLNNKRDQPSRPYNITGKVAGKPHKTFLHGRLEMVESHEDYKTSLNNLACHPSINIHPYPWIGLVARGDCPFQTKILNTMEKNNASTIIIYNNNYMDQELVSMDISDKLNFSAIFITNKDGILLKEALDNIYNNNNNNNNNKNYNINNKNNNNEGILVKIEYREILSSESIYDINDHLYKTSTIFLILSFIILSLISIVWFFIYYLQRFRRLNYHHRHHGNQPRFHGNNNNNNFVINLNNNNDAERIERMKISFKMSKIAKKLVDKMEKRKLKPGDPLLAEGSSSSSCPICFEDYKVKDTVRILPCQHVYHVRCVDGWLIQQRRCPMCQFNIIKIIDIQMPEEFEMLNLVNLPLTSHAVTSNPNPPPHTPTSNSTPSSHALTSVSSSSSHTPIPTLSSSISTFVSVSSSSFIPNNTVNTIIVF